MPSLNPKVAVHDHHTKRTTSKDTRDKLLMDLSLLRDTLPPSNLAQADRALLDNFKAAALSITTLYRSGLHSSKRAYSAGYASALKDVLNFVQAGVSAEGRMAELGGHDGSGALGLNLNFDVDGDGMTIGRVMDWVESRLETISSEEDDAEGGGGGSGREEEEEKNKTGRRRDKAKASAAPKPAPTGRSEPFTVENPPAPLASAPTPPAATTNTLRPTATVVPPSSSPPRPAPAQSQPTVTLTRSKSKADKHLRQAISTQPFPFNPSLGSTAVRIHDIPVQPLDSPLDHAATAGFDFEFGQSVPETPHSLLGSKRRHSALVSELPNMPTSSNNGGSSSGSTRGTVHGSGSTRRRPRGLAAMAGSRSNGQTDLMDAMDIEEQEPARKRIARR